MSPAQALDLAAATVELHTGNGAQSNPWPAAGCEPEPGAIDYGRVAAIARAAQASAADAEALLRDCLRALNVAPRFNYGERMAGRAYRYHKPDSYDLAARLEAHLREPITRPERLPADMLPAGLGRFTGVCPECSKEGTHGQALTLRVDAAGNPEHYPRHSCGAVLQLYAVQS